MMFSNLSNYLNETHTFLTHKRFFYFFHLNDKIQVIKDQQQNITLIYF